MNEKSLQTYFMKQCPHGYRTALVSGSGFPDALLIAPDGIGHYFVELKLLQVGSSGNKSIHTVYKPTQPPWHLKYIVTGGKRLYTIFKLNKGYGAVHETKDYVMELAKKKITYSDLIAGKYRYMEYNTLTELIRNEFQ